MASDQKERVMVVADDLGAEKELRSQLEKLAGGRALEVKIVAPVRPESSLDLFTGEIDDAIDGARWRAERHAGESQAAGPVERIDVEIGDADQLLAIEDALATFEADRIVLVDPEDGLLENAQERFEVPVEVLDAP
jgi:hypothetical protein